LKIDALDNLEKNILKIQMKQKDKHADDSNDKKYASRNRKVDDRKNCL